MPKLPSARVPGDLWSLPTSCGEDVADVLADESALAELLSRAAQPAGTSTLRTNRTPAFLQWRYGRSPIGYRARLVGATLADGLVLFRMRRRGNATELVIADAIVPADSSRRCIRKLCGGILQASGADYAVAVGTSRPSTWLPVPRKGPLLVWRRLGWAGARPTRGEWHVSTGDVELF